MIEMHSFFASFIEYFTLGGQWGPFSQMHTNWNKNDEVTYIYSVWCFTNIISACTIIQKKLIV